MSGSSSETVVFYNEAELSKVTNTYGALALAISVFMPTLWKLVFSQSSSLNTTGYKVAAYINMIFFGPYGLSMLIYWTFGSSKFATGALESTARFSVAGPWFFNFYTIFVLLWTGLVDTSINQFLGFFGYLFFSAVTMAY